MRDPSPYPSQAEAMIRRVSPEGRALARKHYERRKRAAVRLIGRIILAGIAILLATSAVDRWLIPVDMDGAIAAFILFVVTAVLIAMMSRERPAAVQDIADSGLRALPDRAGEWLDQQRAALPAPATPLIDGIGHRLQAMAPQLARLDPNEPAADAVRKLIAVELPDLVTRYQDLPPTLRSRTRADGQSPDSHLLDGLALIDGEIARMTEQLARGAYDELATQKRYLELKYEGDAGLDERATR